MFITEVLNAKFHTNAVLLNEEIRGGGCGTSLFMAAELHNAHPLTKHNRKCQSNTQNPLTLRFLKVIFGDLQPPVSEPDTKKGGSTVSDTTNYRHRISCTEHAVCDGAHGLQKRTIPPMF